MAWQIPPPSQRAHDRVQNHMLCLVVTSLYCPLIWNISVFPWLWHLWRVRIYRFVVVPQYVLWFRLYVFGGNTTEEMLCSHCIISGGTQLPLCTITVDVNWSLGVFQFPQLFSSKFHPQVSTFILAQISFLLWWLLNVFSWLYHSFYSY